MRRHRFAPASLIFGLVFAGLGASFLVGGGDIWQVNWSWFWPAVLILGGIALASSTRNRQAPTAADTPVAEEPVSDS